MRGIKRLYGASYVLSVASLLVSGIFIALMPDTVPAHYDFAGEVDRFGSKYEYLLLPALIILTGFLTNAAARSQAKKGAVQNEKIFRITGLFMVAFFSFMNQFFVIKAYRYGADSTPLDTSVLMNFTTMGIGVMLVALGNIMPKARLNAAFGLRTKWSMANDRVWQKSQRIGGYMAVIAGSAMILCGIFVKGIACPILMMALIIIWTVASIVASYRIYKKDLASEQ